MQFGFNLSDKNSCTDCCCCCDRFTLAQLLSDRFLLQEPDEGWEPGTPFVIEWTPPRSVDEGGNPVRESEPCDGPGADDPPPDHNEFVKCNDLEDPASNPCCKLARLQPPRGRCTTNGICVDNVLARDCAGNFVENANCDGNPVLFEPISWEWACPAGQWRPWTACLRFLCRCVRSDGSVVCSKEYGGPTVNDLDLTTLFIDHFGPEPEPGCYIYEAQFFGWRRRTSTYGIPGEWPGPGETPDPACDDARENADWSVNEYCTFISRDDAYCLFRGKISENCGQWPRGACCETCSCTRTYEANCAGTWIEGAVCEDHPCGEQPTGSCCQGDGSCTVTTACDCSATWTEDGVCDPNPCPQPGSCCNAGECTQTLEANCAGTWTEGESCDPNPCPQLGSCCVYDADGNLTGFSDGGVTEDFCMILYGANQDGFFTNPPPGGLGWTIVWTEGGSAGDCPPSA